ncbi:MAG: hypothetical protein OIF57_11725 [Marinobacterium sp.]|nr:hypothetical protein [Marinobacterium sp.]
MAGDDGGGLLQSMVVLLPTGALALIGGAVDYLYALHMGRREWSLVSFTVHLLFAAFIGYLVAMAAIGLGYSAELAGAAAGAGGVGNVKLIDMAVIWWRKRYAHSCE